MSLQFEQVAGPFEFTEGPAWDGKGGILHSDIPTSRIMRYDVATGGCEEFRHGTNESNGLMFDRDGRLYGCEGGPDGRRVVRYEADGSTVCIAERFEGQRLNSPNDLAFDEHGRLWFTDPRYGDIEDDLELDHQSVFRLEHNPAADTESWTITRVTFDTTKPNGLLISQDQQRLYVAQSHYHQGNARELRMYPIKGDGSLGLYEVLHNFYPHRGIDGMCLDTEGNIIATAGSYVSGPGPMIYVFAPNGRVMETHPLPVDMPTNCTFGDDDLRTLYVTASGCLFRVRTERTGQLTFPSS